jgi:thymidylate kinase
MLLILEGVEAVGKTSIARELQNIIPLHTLIKFSGSPKDVNDNSYMRNIYEGCMDLFLALEKQVLILDRFYLSEMVYSQLFKNYDTDYLFDYDYWIKTYTDAKLFYFNASDDALQERLEKKRVEFSRENHPSFDTIKRIQREYIVQLEYLTIPVYWVETDGLTPRQIAERVVSYAGIINDIETAYTDPIKGE